MSRCISILGSTGSIGRQSLDVIAACGMRVRRHDCQPERPGAGGAGTPVPAGLAVLMEGTPQLI